VIVSEEILDRELLLLENRINKAVETQAKRARREKKAAGASQQ